MCFNELGMEDNILLIKNIFYLKNLKKLKLKI